MNAVWFQPARGSLWGLLAPLPPQHLPYVQVTGGEHEAGPRLGFLAAVVTCGGLGVHGEGRLGEETELLSLRPCGTDAWGTCTCRGCFKPWWVQRPPVLPGQPDCKIGGEQTEGTEAVVGVKGVSVAIKLQGWFRGPPTFHVWGLVSHLGPSVLTKTGLQSL